MACGNIDDSCELLGRGLFTAGDFVFSFSLYLPELEVVGYADGRFQGCRSMSPDVANHMGCCAAIG